MTGGTAPELERAAAALRRAQRWLIVTHDLPDGDAVGSSLALALACDRLGKTAVVACDSPVPDCYTFLPTVDRIGTAVCADVDVVLYVDCADQTRTSVRVSGDVTVVNIDHHPTNNRFGDVNVIQPEASAVGEQIFSLLPLLDINIDPDIATCLYTSIITDTGSFQFANTTPDALQVCSQLIRLGADPYRISDQVFGTRRRQYLKLLGRALKSLTFAADGSIAWMIITRADLEECAAEDQDADGIINYARMAPDVAVGLLFKQQPDKIKIGFRGRPGVDVSAIAGSFGGGGHAGAAGCTVCGELSSVVKRVVAACIRAVTGT